MVASATAWPSSIGLARGAGADVWRSIPHGTRSALTLTFDIVGRCVTVLGQRTPELADLDGRWHGNRVLCPCRRVRAAAPGGATRSAMIATRLDGPGVSRQSDNATCA